MSDCAYAWAALPINAGSNLKVYGGSQSDVALLQRIIAERGPFDVIVDDGGHTSVLQRASLLTLFPEGLAVGGTYFLEDTYFSRIADPFDVPTAVGLIQDIAEALVACGEANRAVVSPTTELSLLMRVVEGVEHMDCYPGMCVLVKYGDERGGTHPRATPVTRGA